MPDFVYQYAQEILLAAVAFGSGWLASWIRRQVKKPSR